jgi:hypothetical protein
MTSPGVVCRALPHSPGPTSLRTFPQLNLHKARIRRNHGRLPSHGFIERAPEHRARVNFFLKSAPADKARLGSNQEFEETTTNTRGTASVQRVGMHIFHQAVIVAIVYRHADNYWALHREGPLQCRRDLLWTFDLQSSGAKSLGKLDDIDWSQVDVPALRKTAFPRDGWAAFCERIAATPRSPESLIIATPDSSTSSGPIGSGMRLKRSWPPAARTEVDLRLLGAEVP